MYRLLTAVAVFCILCGQQASAAIVTVNFDSDPVGATSTNPYMSPGFPEVTFFDDNGSNLQIAVVSGVFPVGATSSGNQFLAIGDTDPSALVFTFSQLVDSLSFTFGGDVNLASQAVLTLFNGGAAVGSPIVVSTTGLSGNVINPISSGVPINFDSARFVFTGANGNPADALELVDTIVFNTVTAIPEPSSLMLLGVGAVFSLRRRRR